MLTEYFFKIETFQLNWPPVPRVEDDNPEAIIEPSGLQYLEELVYRPSSENLRPVLKQANNKIAAVLKNMPALLEGDPFREELVWDATRYSTLGIMTNGITGHDSPIANLSLKEAVSTLQSLRDIWMILVSKRDPENHSKTPLLTRLNAALNYLEAHQHFDKFNRLDFISNYMDPLYAELVHTRISLGVGVPEGTWPVDPNAVSIFAENALNINFYSPNSDMLMTRARVALGKKIFFDTRLSSTKKRSCATCHQPDKAFTDNLRTALSLEGNPMKRNTPTLLNAAFQLRQFHDSRSDLLENQFDEVVHNPAEMGGSLKDMVKVVEASPEYVQLFKEAYPKLDGISPIMLGNVVACYIRSLVSLNSRFDQYMRGDHTKMNELEKTGFNIFTGKGKCATCHFLPLFNGLAAPGYDRNESEVVGVPAFGISPAKLDPDEGKAGFTMSKVDSFSFKTPSLRNIELTFPYMHNGVFKTLEEVVDFYNKGGGKGLNIGPSNQTLPFEKLNLTKKEQKALVAFMKTLTDTSSVNH